MSIRVFEQKDLSKIELIIAKLHPGWFDNNALRNIPIDIQLGTSFISEENSEIRGFIVVSSLDGTVWINWMGVDPQFHGNNIGSELLEYVVTFLKKIGVKELNVDTVIEQIPADGTYDRTIQFYLKKGFQIVERKELQKYKEFTYRRGTLRKYL